MGCSQCQRMEDKTDILTESIGSYEQLYEAIRKGHKLVVLENVVVDVSKFAIMHPGGCEVLLNNIGTEVSRFYYGGFQYRSFSSEITKIVNNNKHQRTIPQDQLYQLYKQKHFIETSQRLIEKISVGCINVDLQKRIFLPQRSLSDGAIERESWKVVSKKMVSGVHAVFQFRSANFKSAAILPYFSHCGKYYSLYSTQLKMYRNLACIFTPSESILGHYLSLLDAFLKGEYFPTKFPDINHVQKDHLELYLKKLNVFSSYIHDFPFGQEDSKGIINDFKIRGPFGPGLMIGPDQKNVIVGITCGTGVVLFLDLAMYILRMNIFKAGKANKKTYLIFGNENFDQLTHPSFKLILFSAFKEKSHVLGEPLFRALHDISAKYNFNNFEYYLRISENNDPRWDEETFKTILPKNIYQ